MEEFLEELRIFGTLILQGTENENEAKEALKVTNGLLIENPNLFKVLKDPENQAVFLNAKEILKDINIDKISITDFPKIIQLVPLYKKLNLYN
jgi:hypothetical protein